MSSLPMRNPRPRPEDSSAQCGSGKQEVNEKVNGIENVIQQDDGEGAIAGRPFFTTVLVNPTQAFDSRFSRGE